MTTPDTMKWDFTNVEGVDGSALKLVLWLELKSVTYQTIDITGI